jgi:hypothetical protein
MTGGERLILWLPSATRDGVHKWSELNVMSMGKDEHGPGGARIEAHFGVQVGTNEPVHS